MSARQRTAILAASLVVLVLLGALLAPWPVRLGPQSAGDSRLADRVRSMVSPTGRTGLSVAVVEDGRLTQAAVGEAARGRPMTTQTPLEIGSVTKTLTASVLAEMIDSGELQPDTRVRDVLTDRDWPDGSVGDATVADLASHRSGLPRNALLPSTYLGSLRYVMSGAAPPATTPEQIPEIAAGSPRPTTGQYAYSNLGFELLGQLLAEQSGRSYPDLMQSELFGPVGLEHTVIGTAPEQVSAGAAAGHDNRGRTLQPWISPGGAPAGSGVWSTSADLARFADQVMRGRAPGADATEPRFPAGGGDTEIGYAWHTTTQNDTSLVWHNGVAGGCSTFVGFDRDRERVVVVMNNSADPVDDLGFALLTGSEQPEQRIGASSTGLVIGLAFPLLAGITLLSAVRGGLLRQRTDRIDRVGVIGTGAWAIFLLTFAYGFGGVGYLPAIGWLLGCGLTGVALGLAIPAWRSWPVNVAKRPRGHWVGTGIAALAAVLALLLALI